jgi:hypothetical protein
MGICKYCGENAGFLRKQHKACHEKYLKGWNTIINKVTDTISEKTDFKSLEKNVELIASESFVKKESYPILLVKGFDNAVEKFLEDGIISEEEENRVSDFKDHFNLSQDQIDETGSWTKMVQGSILREVMDGNIPERFKVEGILPFNFQKTEKLIYFFNNVEYYEKRTKTVYKGGYSGVSLRIAKGVYYRKGGFKGHPVQTEEMRYLGDGFLAITDRHIYFSSTLKTFRIKFDKVIALEPYEDGIGLQKDGVTAKPQIFKNIDGWFTYNLISNLSQL